MKRVLIGIVALIALSSVSALAEDPAYMHLKAGEAVEIKGEWTKDGVFTAKEIEILPIPRRPKLRGTIADIDTSTQQILVFGQWIAIAPATQFLGVVDEPVGLSLMKTSDRVEVSCRQDSTGAWIARHIRFKNVKSSDKVKGTITRTSFEGRSTDTLSISGLPVAVTKKTEIFRTLGTPADTGGANDGGELSRPEIQ